MSDLHTPPTTPGITRVWAWALGRSLHLDEDGQPGEVATSQLRRAIDLGLTDVCLVLNDCTGGKGWHLFAGPKSIRQCCATYLAAGIAPHLMSWIRPDARFIAGMVRDLLPLMDIPGLRSLMLDAEEPWRGGKGQEEIAAMFAHDFQAHTTVPLGVTDVPYGLGAELRPLIDLADYLCPQAYSFKSTAKYRKPGVLQPRSHAMWRTFGKPLVMGLYGRRQAEGSVAACAAATEALREPAVDEVCYWSLPELRGATGADVKTLCGRVRG